MFIRKLWCKSTLIWALLLTISLGAYLAQAGFKHVSASVRLKPSIAMLAGTTCNAISGFVYYDANNNGIKDVGEAGIGNSTLELRNASNAVVGTAITDPSGFYQFTIDATIDTSPQTQTFTANFPDTSTNWASSATVPQFNP
ncbi:MAG TPA: SdrD B-like domain-containing protein, partial [Blastocatellia bacterium]|nr:SdrD B-like domain-containing protein [Blastocatellia bacterium]